MSTTSSIAPTPTTRPNDAINWVASIPYFLFHVLSVVGVWYVGFKWQWLLLFVASYYLRMLFVTIGYHRYFSHRAFQANRVVQFLLAFGAQSSSQKGALWWAAHHRHHHKESDQEADIHSPIQKGFWWSHHLWILSYQYEETRYELIKDFARFPELRFLNKYYWIPLAVLLLGLFAIGGLPWLVYGGVLATTVLWHGTFTINSLSHVFGKRRYITTDTSRNNFLLALITCGEGWHNNHHFHQNTANQGWFWWEVDFSFYVLKAANALGLVSKLRLPAEQTKMSYLKYTDAQRAQLYDFSKLKPGAAVPDPAPSPAPAPIGVVAPTA